MKLSHGLHLGYCTNAHRGETWAETFATLEEHARAVRERVGTGQPFGLSLRLSNRAAHELSDPATLRTFHRWLDAHGCYVFTIQGFPCGHLHGRLAKPRVFLPDWTSAERLAHTNLLFDLLAQLMPVDVEGTVGTLPGSFKSIPLVPEELKLLRANLWHCLEHAARVSDQTQRRMRLALEPGPLGLLETSGEVIQFFDRLRGEHPQDARLLEFLAVNYDACHFAVEFEEPANAISYLHEHGVRVAKCQLGSAVRVCPEPEVCERLAALVEDVYEHQVVAQLRSGKRVIYRNLAQALAQAAAPDAPAADEWRIHVHVPLHGPDGEWFLATTDHVLGLLDLLAANPQLCPHLEMETQTADLLPPELRQRSSADQVAAEYGWVLQRLAERGLVTLG